MVLGQKHSLVWHLGFFSADSPNPMGFEPMINQRLLPPTFPRYTRIKPRIEALQYFDELVARLRHAWKITSCTNFHTALVMYRKLKLSVCPLFIKFMRFTTIYDIFCWSRGVKNQKRVIVTGLGSQVGHLET